MKVYLKPTCVLVEYFGTEIQEIELPSHGNVRELLVEIDLKWGAELPASIWNREKCEFRGPIFLITNKKILNNLETKLDDEQKIEILKVMVGG